MLSLVLHPQVAPAGRLRLWLGVFNSEQLPANIEWRLDGIQVTARPVRQLGPAHDFGSRCFTGVFELNAVAQPGRPYRVDARAAGTRSPELSVRSLPEVVPEGDWLRVLLISCYHRDEDRGGLVGRACRNLAAAERPDLTLLMGDQVYLDLPTLKSFPDDRAKLAARFEADHRGNWDQQGGLSAILDAAPSVCCPDDHEYWNNFPHSSPIIQNSWRESSRQNWKTAADQAFDAFQLAAPARRGDPVEIDIDPLSVIVLDQRSQRRGDLTATLTPTALARLNTWVDRLIREEKYGAVVTGQSLLDEPVSDFEAKTMDRMLANYADYPRVMGALERLANAGRPVLLLTGDVHWGRVTAIERGGRSRFYEIVCSPSSLVTTVGADQLKSIGSGLSALFGGKRKRWPRHAIPPDPEPFLAPQVFGKKYRTNVLHKQQGDQLAMLALRRSAGTLEAKVTYYEVHESPRQPVDVRLGLLRAEA